MPGRPPAAVWARSRLGLPLRAGHPTRMRAWTPPRAASHRQGRRTRPAWGSPAPSASASTSPSRAPPRSTPTATSASTPPSQARRCWEIALGALAELGGRPEDVIRTRHYITDGDAEVVDAVSSVHGEIFGEIRPGEHDGRRRRPHRPAVEGRGRARRRRRRLAQLSRPAHPRRSGRGRRLRVVARRRPAPRRSAPTGVSSAGGTSSGRRRSSTAHRPRGPRDWPAICGRRHLGARAP